VVRYREGISRDQMVLYQETLDELVDPESMVRIIDAYVDALDMGGMGFQVNACTMGAPAYRPQLKLKIYLYGYLNKIRSSRGLEKESKRNIELIWLTEGLSPDFKTIADFRKDNSSALKKLFEQFLHMCGRKRLIEFQTVAIDGTKLRGQNSLNEIYRRETIAEVEEEIRRRVDAYLAELDELDEREKKSGFRENAEQIKKVTKRLRKQEKRAEKVSAFRKIFDEDPEVDRIFGTDKDARLQSDKGKVRSGYNVQTGVDEKHKLIVINDVTNEQNDKKQLNPMSKHIEQQKRALGVEEDTVVIADTGYFSEAAIMEAQKLEGCRVLVSAGAEGADPSKNLSGKGQQVPARAYENDAFFYDDDRDIYLCPERQELRRVNQKPVIDKNGRATHRYRGEEEVCNACPLKAQCTKSDKGRMLRVTAYRQEMEEYLQQLRQPESKRAMSKRKELAEHPFGTLKRTFGYTYFLMKGLEKVKAEMNLMSLVYNFKRVFNIVGYQMMMNMVQADG